MDISSQPVVSHLDGWMQGHSGIRQRCKTFEYTCNVRLSASLSDQSEKVPKGWKLGLGGG